MNTTMQISANRLLLLKKLLELRDIVININESQTLLSDELKNLEYKRQKYVRDRNEFLQSKNYFMKDNNALNFIKSEDFKRLCITTYCNLHNSFSYTLCHYENLNGMWCVTSNDQETFDDNNSIMDYIRDLASKYDFEILDFINTIGREKYESFNLSHFMIDELSTSLQEKIQNYYRLQLSNMVEDYNEEMKMQVTFRPSVPYESCSAYRKKQVDLVEEVSKLKDELKEKLEKLIYVIPEQFIEEENLTKIQSYYLMKFQESDAGKRLNNILEFKQSEVNQYINNMSIIESKNTSLADMKNKVISKYCTFLPAKYIFNEYVLNCFVKYIYYEQADNIEQCINIFEHMELQEEIIEQTISLRHVIDNLKDSVVNQLSKVSMKLDTLVMNTRAVNENMGTIISGHSVIVDSASNAGQELNKINSLINSNNLIAEGKQIQDNNYEKLMELGNDTQRLYLTILKFNRECVNFINKIKCEKCLEGKVYY